ncbi:MAG: HEAT repeat domain-containing protein [Myxococcota bacterium]
MSRGILISLVALSVFPSCRDDEPMDARAARQHLRSVGSGEEPGPEVLRALLHHPSEAVRLEAVATVRATGDSRHVTPLLGLLADPDPHVAMAAARAAAGLGGEEALSVLRRRARVGAPPEAAAALAGLRYAQASAPLEALERALDSPYSALLLEGVRGLRLAEEPEATAWLRQATDDPRPVVRATAVREMVYADPLAAADVSREALGDAAPEVRAAGVEAAGRVLPREEAEGVARERIDAPSPGVRRAARRVLERLEPAAEDAAPAEHP